MLTHTNLTLSCLWASIILSRTHYVPSLYHTVFPHSSVFQCVQATHCISATRYDKAGTNHHGAKPRGAFAVTSSETILHVLTRPCNARFLWKQSHLCFVLFCLYFQHGIVCGYAHFHTTVSHLCYATGLFLFNWLRKGIKNVLLPKGWLEFNEL